MSATTRRRLVVAALVLVVGVAHGCGSDGDDLDEFRTGSTVVFDQP